MRIDDFNWEALYEKVDNYMKSIKAKKYNIVITGRTLFEDEPIVRVHVPKRVNVIAIMMLDKNNACSKRKGYKKDGKLYCTYNIRVNQLN